MTANEAFGKYAGRKVGYKSGECLGSEKARFIGYTTGGAVVLEITDEDSNIDTSCIVEKRGSGYICGSNVFNGEDDDLYMVPGLPNKTKGYVEDFDRLDWDALDTSRSGQCLDCGKIYTTSRLNHVCMPRVRLMVR